MLEKSLERFITRRLTDCLKLLRAILS